jgi:alkylhydroperoxidase family enzyme
VTLTAQPWTLTPDAVADAGRQGLDEKQIETAVGVISMFNYFTRVADATGIEFDYPTPLPAFEPDLCQVTAPRPDRPGSPAPDAGGHRLPRQPQLLQAWESWRAYLLDSEEPLSRRERRLLATVAAQETTDWVGAEALDGLASGRDGDEPLIAFARKLSRQPWAMQAADLDGLRAAGYPEQAVLHVVSLVAHQNAYSRLAIGLGVASRI